MNSRLLFNHSYFYDALSGGFKPPSDEERRTHTLARLINATVEKDPGKNIGTHNQLHKYRPSWAPISSIVRISHWNVSSLTMISDERALSFTHALDGTEPRELIIMDTAHGHRPLLEAPLGHEFGYHGLQERVRDIAQGFFDAFPAPEVIPIQEKPYNPYQPLHR